MVSSYRSLSPELMRIIDESPYVKKAMKEYFGIDEDTDLPQNDKTPHKNPNPATDASQEDASDDFDLFGSPLSELSPISQSGSDAPSPPVLSDDDNGIPSGSQVSDEGSQPMSVASQGSGTRHAPLSSPPAASSSKARSLVPAYAPPVHAAVSDMMSAAISAVNVQPPESGATDFTDQMQGVVEHNQNLPLFFDVPGLLPTTDHATATLAGQLAPCSLVNSAPTQWNCIPDQQRFTQESASTINPWPLDTTWQDLAFNNFTEPPSSESTGYQPTLDDLENVLMHSTDLNISIPAQMPQVSYDAPLPQVDYSSIAFDGAQLPSGSFPVTNFTTLGQPSMDMQGIYLPNQPGIDPSTFGGFAHGAMQPQYAELYGHLGPASTFSHQNVQNPFALGVYPQMANANPVAASYSQMVGPSQTPWDLGFANEYGAYPCIDGSGAFLGALPLHLQQNNVNQLHYASQPTQMICNLMHATAQWGPSTGYAFASSSRCHDQTGNHNAAKGGPSSSADEAQEVDTTTGARVSFLCLFDGCSKILDTTGTINDLRLALLEHGHLPSRNPNKRVTCKWVDDDTPPCRHIIDEKNFPRHIGQHLGIKPVNCRFCEKGKGSGFATMHRHYRRCEGFARMDEEKQKREWEKVTNRKFKEYQMAMEKKRKAAQAKLYKRLREEKAAGPAD